MQPIAVLRNKKNFVTLGKIYLHENMIEWELKFSHVHTKHYILYFGVYYIKCVNSKQIISRDDLQRLKILVFF